MKKYYVVYSKHDDTVLAQGNAEVCRKQLGFKTAAVFYSMVSRCNRGLTDKYEVCIMDSEDEEESE